MEKWLITPPVAFIVILCAAWLAARLLSRLAFRTTLKTNGSRQSYACGEENYDHMAQPDYSNFFPFAFFFTLAHVATLIMTTVPTETLETFVLAAIYIIGATLGLYILFRR
ncbi:MAG: hypothetical protein PHS93_02905 [Candidatus Omnitrophica bacterium]|nr:hypothetical protein [Candidatus Omnitrophota bacterium]MDD5352100.1 hypothetical protein [Candidatus Omnitrophota bacterium]MDD5549698.1 hypothetical protein [Candidatus Omnitrophota bacterium]